MNIGLLGCDHVAERFLPIAGDYRDLFAALFKPYVSQLSLEYFDACNGELPSKPDVCDAYVCTGSRFSAYDDAAWIRALEDFVRELRDSRKPFVGICFGHQILAQALGGSVARAQQGWGIGVHDMKILERESWMQPQLTSCALQYMHQDQVQSLPPDATLLASCAHCPIAMFRVGKTMLGIEGHPEFPAALNKALIIDRKERIETQRVQAALASVSEPTDATSVAKWIYEFVSKAVGSSR